MKEHNDNKNERFKEIYNNLPFIIFTLDKTGKIIDGNKIAQKTIGYSKEEITGKLFTKLKILVEKKDLFNAVMEFAKNLRGRVTHPTIYRIRTKQGEEKMIKLVGIPIKQNGKIVEVIDVGEDVTESLKSDLVIKESEEKYRAWIDQAGDAFYMLDTKGRYVYGNKKAEELSGYKMSEWIGKSAIKIVPKSEYLKYAKLYGNLLLYQEPIRPLRTSLLRKDGSLVPIETTMSPYYIKGKLAGYMGVSRDITEQLKSEEKLKESEQKYRQLYEGSGDGFIMVSLGQKILSTNKSFRLMLGYSEEELKKIYYKDLTPKKWHKMNQQIMDEQIAKRGYSDVYEKELIRKDGKVIPVELRTYLIKDESGKPTGVWAFIREISEKKQAEAIIFKSKKRYEDLVNNLPIGIYRNTPGKEGKFIEVNPAFVKMFEASSKDQMLKHNTRELYQNPAKRELFSKKLLKQGYVKNEEAELVTLKGRKFWGAITAIAQKSDKGESYFDGFIEDITERKQAEEKIRESEEKYRNLFESAQDAIYITDAKGFFINGNKMAEELTGYKREELVGKSFVNLVSDKADIPKMFGILKDIVLNKKKSYKFEARIKRKDGSVALIDVVGAVVEVRGKIVGMQGIARNVTERRKAEEALKASEEKLRLITDNMYDMVSQTDLLGKIQYASPSHKAVLGYSPEEMIGKLVYDFVHPSSVKDIVNLAKEVIKTRSSGRMEIYSKRKDGKYVWLEIIGKVVLDKKGKVVGAVFNSRDISDRKKAEEAVRASEERFRLITENMLDLVVKTDIKGIIEYASPSHKIVLGYDPQELIGTSVFKLAHPRSLGEIMKLVAKTIKTKSSGGMEFEVMRKDGNYIWIDAVGQTILDKRGRVIGAVFNSRDISDRKKAEKAVYETAKELEAINQIIVLGNKAENLSELLNLILEQIIGLMKFDIGGIYLINQQNGQAELAVSQGMTKELAKKLKIFSQQAGQNLYEKVLVQGESVIAEDLSEFSPESARDISLASAVSLPLFSKGKIIGAMNFGNKQKRSFTEFEKNAINIVSQELGSVIARMQTEEELKKREEDYRKVVEEAQDGIFTVDLTGRFLSGNKKCEEMSGYTREELIGKSFVNVLPKKEISKLLGVFKNIILKKMSRYVFETEILNKNKKIIPVEIIANVMKKEGKIIGVQGVARDITERKQIQEKINESEKKYRAIFESSNDVMVIIDKAGTIIDGNKRISDIGGYSREDFVGKKINALTSMFPTKTLAVILSNFAKRIIGVELKPYEIEARTKDGGLLTFELSAYTIKDENKKVLYEVAVLHDVTERKKAEAAIRQSEEKFESVVENIPMHISLIDLSGKFIFWNQYSEKLFGYTQEDVIGKLSSKNVHETQAEANLVINTATKEGIFNDELNLVRKDKTKFRAHLIVLPRKDERGKIIGFFGIAEDISERKKAEVEIKKHVEEMERLNKVMIGRELKMIELKKELERLKETR